MYLNSTSTLVKCIQRDNAIVGKKKTKLNDLLIHKNLKPCFDSTKIFLS
jgi:hypothetical protein